MLDYRTSGLTLDVSIVRTARWVALAILLVVVLASTALWFGWKGLKYAESTQKALSEEIQAIRDSSDATLAALASLQQQVTENDAKERDLQGELKVLTNRLQLTQDDLELARRQNRLFNQTQAEQGPRVQQQSPTESKGGNGKPADVSPKESQTNQK